ncbi:MAG: RluA family pseudouridine synthase [Pseudomonadota bacterium]
MKVTPHYEGERIDSFIALQLPWRSRNKVVYDIKKGIVLLNGQKTKASKKLKNLDFIHIAIHADPNAQALFQGKLEIIYEDDDLLAINKPACLAVHSTKRHFHDNVLTILRKQLLEQGGIKEITDNFRLVHRLDFETSGVLLLTKNPDIHTELALQFENREVEKEYLAIVCGKPADNKACISGDIVDDSKSIIKIKKAVDLNNNLHVKTRYELIKKLGDFSLLRIKPCSGKQHQIRVHLKCIGCPIVGDKLYGPNEEYFLLNYEGRLHDLPADLYLNRHALHASSLKIKHPANGSEVLLNTGLPDDMQKFIDLNG